MTVSEAVADYVDEAVTSTELISLPNMHLEPRCRVCRNDGVRQKVNGLLATGASYAMVVRSLSDDNAGLEKCDQVTIDSVRNHTARHFPVQNVAMATYREILERRAREVQLDFVDGVATAITPMAFLETVMTRSYETLVDSNTTVDVTTGINAATRLQQIIDSRTAEQASLLEMRLQVGRIIDAVKSTVPKALWPAIVRSLEGSTNPAARNEDFYDQDDACDPSELAFEADFDDD